LQAAAEAEQASRNLQRTFGAGLAADLSAIGEGAADRWGLSTREFEQLAATLGTAMTAVGVPADQAAGMIEPLTTRLADLSAATGKDMPDAVSALTGMLRNEMDAIGEFGVIIEDWEQQAWLAEHGMSGLTGEAESAALAQANLALFFEKSDQYAGAFAETSDTLAGKMDTTSAKFENVKASAGAFLAEGLVKLWEWMETDGAELWLNFQLGCSIIYNAIQPLIPLFHAFADLVGTVLTAIMTNLDALIDFVMAVFKGQWGAAWDAVVQSVRGSWTAITSIFGNALAGIGELLRSAKETVSGAAGAVAGSITGAFGSVKEGIKNTLTGLAETITAPFRSAFNSIKNLWNTTVAGFGFTVPSWIPGVGGKSWTIPTMASGGIVMGPTLALIGEAGPEAVIPLGGHGVGGVVVNIQVGVGDPVAIGREVADVLERYGRWTA
jgi:hypothetical protein